MSKWFAAASLFALAFPVAAWAIPLWPVMDTASFVEKAKDILIVKCTTPDVHGGGKEDGLTLVEVEVLAVVKGGRKAGKARLATIGQPMAAGSRYLMASFGGDAFGTGFLAQSDQAVVEIPADFDLKTLAGRTPVEQTQAVFRARRAQLDRVIRQLRREKEVLDKAEGSSSPGK